MAGLNVGDLMKIYLAGKMSGLSHEEMTKWRREVKEYFKYYDWVAECIDPTDFYNFTQGDYTEKEVMEFDLHAVRNCDLVLVNLQYNSSIGTAMELMLAKELHIPVVGFDNTPHQHPWVEECVTVFKDSWRDATEYIGSYYSKIL